MFISECEVMSIYEVSHICRNSAPSRDGADGAIMEGLTRRRPSLTRCCSSLSYVDRKHQPLPCGSGRPHVDGVDHEADLCGCVRVHARARALTEEL